MMEIAITGIRPGRDRERSRRPRGRRRPEAGPKRERIRARAGRAGDPSPTDRRLFPLAAVLLPERAGVVAGRDAPGTCSNPEEPNVRCFPTPRRSSFQPPRSAPTATCCRCPARSAAVPRPRSSPRCSPAASSRSGSSRAPRGRPCVQHPLAQSRRRSRRPAADHSGRSRRPRHRGRRAAVAAPEAERPPPAAKGARPPPAPLVGATSARRARPARAPSRRCSSAMLGRAEGATIDEIVAATGWQPHTVRGAFAGALKKRLGLTIDIGEARGARPSLPDSATVAEEPGCPGLRAPALAPFTSLPRGEEPGLVIAAMTVTILADRRNHHDTSDK